MANSRLSYICLKFFVPDRKVIYFLSNVSNFVIQDFWSLHLLSISFEIIHLGLDLALQIHCFLQYNIADMTNINKNVVFYSCYLFIHSSSELTTKKSTTQQYTLYTKPVSPLQTESLNVLIMNWFPPLIYIFISE